MENIDIKIFVGYEVRSSLIAQFIWFGWGQKLMGRYFAWKVNVKYKRYIASDILHEKMIKKYGEGFFKKGIKGE